MMNISFETTEEGGIRILPSKFYASTDAEFLAFGVLYMLENMTDEDISTIIGYGEAVSFETVQ